MSKLYASISADASRTEATRRGHRSITSKRASTRASDDLLGNVALLNGYRYFFPAPTAEDRAIREQARWLTRRPPPRSLTPDKQSRAEGAPASRAPLSLGGLGTHPSRVLVAPASTGARTGPSASGEARARIGSESEHALRL